VQVQTDDLRRWFCAGAARGICIEFFIIKCIKHNDDLRRRYCPGVVCGVCAYLYMPQVTKVNVNLEEVLSNMRTVRHFAMETHEAERYAKHLSSTKG
jgi:ABC-type multidrug transport system fused ATPase/permease subunit